jgi:hypothetical protein
MRRSIAARGFDVVARNWLVSFWSSWNRVVRSSTPASLNDPVLGRAPALRRRITATSFRLSSWVGCGLAENPALGSGSPAPGDDAGLKQTLYPSLASLVLHVASR